MEKYAADFLCVRPAKQLVLAIDEF